MASDEPQPPQYRGVSARSRSVDRSSIRIMFDRAADYDGDLVHLEIGEPDFDTPEHIVQAGAQAAEAGKTDYTANAGLLNLREAIARHGKLGADYNPATDIVVTNGGMEALYLAMLTVVDSGDEVIIPTPAWPSYQAQTKMVGGVPKTVPLSGGSFEIDLDTIEETISDDTSLVVLTRPSNPTGRIYDASKVEQIADLAEEHDAYLLVDEVYNTIVYDDESVAIADTIGKADHLLIVNSCSKRFAMTGWRVGWLAGPEDVISQATKLHENTTACASNVSQHAAIAALEGPKEPVRRMNEKYRERRDRVADRVDSLQGVSCPVPEGSFYAFLDMRDTGLSSEEISERLLLDHGVVTAPGSGFGDAGDGFVRISFANNINRVNEGLDRIEAFLNEVL
ncbi:pyridoxal phosphate-dependent aminotransferase [Natrarchaeobius chitinivorans]|uniref:Aminotransferase n=1 Tax=Natrarchaeobius chitinivorans TaxID=1679083 RepID=A0A3N6MHW3_NATCH|nr:pyridoxal phosphate-dependent aminotransferase [Natrarchaeobius chitinivorans]RQG96520.1 pyridoxal phosphate-dependent aminotransferase [Natrarchaeobius chitinivorans]